MRDADLGPKLEALWKRNYSVYERRKLTKPARRAGHDVGRDQLARLMRCRGIRGASRAKKRFITKSDPHVWAPGLVNRNFSASRPDELWVCDFTYCSTWSGIVYVAFVIDVLSRRLVSWKAARSITTTLVLDALNMAAWSRRHSDLAGVRCHSDAGSQHTAIAYTERLEDTGAAPSIGTIGDCSTTPWPSRSSDSSKPSCIVIRLPNGGPWKSLDDLEIATCAWVSWFNEERLHGELNDRTPAEVEAEYRLRSQRCGMRNQSKRASIKPRPIHTS